MRTFHTGGVAGADITHGLPRVVEIFEARNPKGAATLVEKSAGASRSSRPSAGPKLTVHPTEVGPEGELADPVEYQLPRRTRLLVTNGQVIESGDALNEGSRNPAELLALKGSTPTELYLVAEVQKVYKSQGVEIHDKHIELIVRQMLKKVRVESAGDTDLLPGQLVDRVVLERENSKAKAAKKEIATFEPLILGITKASLATESFLSRRVVPGDDEGADGRLDRGQDRPPARPEGERDHRQADPGRHRPAPVPRDRDRPDRSGHARRLPAGRPAAGARGDRRRRRLADVRERPRPGPRGTGGEPAELPELDTPIDD